MSTVVLEHPPDWLSASGAPDCNRDEAGSASVAPAKKSFDQLITPEVAGNADFIRRVTAGLIQCCIHRAPIDSVQQCVRWEREIPSDIVTALRIARDSCNAISMADALLAIDDLEERRVILRMMAHAIIHLS